MTRIFVTGGHYTPAKAVVDELLAKGGYEIYYVGRKTSLEGDSALSLEYQDMHARTDLMFLEITTGRLQRRFTKNTIPSLLKIPKGFVQSFSWLSKFKPDLVLTFGGYVGVPVAISAWLLGIPVVAHEQTRVASLSSRLITPFVKKILVSWPEMLANYPKDKAVLTGNPISKDVFEVSNTSDYQNFKKIKKSHAKTTLYVTGGNQGSHSINKLVAEILPKLLNDYLVIHQCGSSEEFDDFETLSKINNPNYLLFKFIDRKNIGWVFNEADLIIGRSGANTVSEILALGKPSLLIPLPWSGGGEAQKNAEALASFGGSKILQQENLTSERLLLEIMSMTSNLSDFQKKSTRAKSLYIPDSAKKIVAELVNVLHAKKN